MLISSSVRTRFIRGMTTAVLAGVFYRGASALAEAPGLFTPGQSVEVREGDSWSAASVLKREGRKYLIHYSGSDSSSDEWVTLDRMRLLRTAAVPAAPLAGESPAPAPTTPATPAATLHPHHPDMPDEVIPEIEPDRSLLDVQPTGDSPDTGTTTWSVLVDPVAKPGFPDSYSLRIHALDEQMGIQQLLACADGGAVIGWTDFGEKNRRLERVGTGSSARVILPSQCLPLAASPSGKLVVCRSNGFGFGKNSRIDAFNLSSSSTSAVPLVSFTPYPGGNFNVNGQDIRFAAALTETRVITADEKGEIIAWDIGPEKAVGAWQTNVVDRISADFWGQGIAVSPGGKWLAVGGAGAVTFIDTANGRVLGEIQASTKGILEDISCSPTGKTVIAKSSDGTLIRFDVARGTVIREVAFPSQALGAMICPDDDFALLDGHALVDANTGAIVPLPKEPLAGHVIAATGRGLVVLASDSKLVFVHLPDSKTKAAALASEDASLLLRPGMNVALDIQVDMDDQKKSEIDAALRKQIADDGFVITPTADTVIQCRTEPGQQHEYHYGKTNMRMPIFMGVGGESMILTTKVTRITIQQKGQTIWEKKREIGPAGSFPLKDGQSLQDLANATIHYDQDFLINMTIPKYIAKNDEQSLLKKQNRRSPFGR
jgi:WD40 repeat protein